MKFVLNLVALAGGLLIIWGIAMWSVPLALIVCGLCIFLGACAIFYEKYGDGS